MALDGRRRGPNHQISSEKKTRTKTLDKPKKQPRKRALWAKSGRLINKGGVSFKKNWHRASNGRKDGMVPRDGKKTKRKEMKAPAKIKREKEARASALNFPEEGEKSLRNKKTSENPGAARLGGRPKNPWRMMGF